VDNIIENQSNTQEIIETTKDKGNDRHRSTEDDEDDNDDDIDTDNINE
jgi:hypothetical protein